MVKCTGHSQTHCSPFAETRFVKKAKRETQTPARLRLDDSFANGVADEVRDGTKTQLPHDRGTMGLHGFDADTESSSDFLVGASARQQPDDFTLTRRQRRRLCLLTSGAQEVLQES